MWCEQRHVRAMTILASSWLLCAVTGCGDNNELNLPPTIPVVMESAGRKWSRQGELSADDSALLDGYFRNHLSEIDNPLFEETAVVFADGRGARRIYWFAMTAEGTRWFYLEFDSRNRFQESGDGVNRLGSVRD